MAFNANKNRNSLQRQHKQDKTAQDNQQNMHKNSKIKVQNKNRQYHQNKITSQNYQDKKNNPAQKNQQQYSSAQIKKDHLNHNHNHYDIFNFNKQQRMNEVNMQLQQNRRNTRKQVDAQSQSFVVKIKSPKSKKIINPFLSSENPKNHKSKIHKVKPKDLTVIVASTSTSTKQKEKQRHHPQPVKHSNTNTNVNKTLTTGTMNQKIPSDFIIINGDIYSANTYTQRNKYDDFLNKVKLQKQIQRKSFIQINNNQSTHLTKSKIDELQTNSHPKNDNNDNKDKNKKSRLVKKNKLSFEDIVKNMTIQDKKLMFKKLQREIRGDLSHENSPENHFSNEIRSQLSINNKQRQSERQIELKHHKFQLLEQKLQTIKMQLLFKWQGQIQKVNNMYEDGKLTYEERQNKVNLMENIKLHKMKIIQCTRILFMKILKQQEYQQQKQRLAQDDRQSSRSNYYQIQNILKSLHSFSSFEHIQQQPSYLKQKLNFGCGLGSGLDLKNYTNIEQKDENKQEKNSQIQIQIFHKEKSNLIFYSQAKDKDKVKQTYKVDQLNQKSLNRQIDSQKQQKQQSYQFGMKTPIGQHFSKFSNHNEKEKDYSNGQNKNSKSPIQKINELTSSHEGDPQQNNPYINPNPNFNFTFNPSYGQIQQLYEEISRGVYNNNYNNDKKQLLLQKSNQKQKPQGSSDNLFSISGLVDLRLDLRIDQVVLGQDHYQNQENAEMQSEDHIQGEQIHSSQNQAFFQQKKQAQKQDQSKIKSKNQYENEKVNQAKSNINDVYQGADINTNFNCQIKQFEKNQPLIASKSTTPPQDNQFACHQRNQRTQTHKIQIPLILTRDKMQNLQFQKNKTFKENIEKHMGFQLGCLETDPYMQTNHNHIHDEYHENVVEKQKRVHFTTLVDINTYIINFYEFMMKKYLNLFVDNLNTPYGKSVIDKLYCIQTAGEVPDESMNLFYNIFTEANFTQYQKEMMLTVRKCSDYQTYHNRAVFQAFNACINEYRPYYESEGQIYTWLVSQKGITFYQINEQNIEQVFEKSKIKVLQTCSTLCGLISSTQPYNEQQKQLLQNRRKQSLNKYINMSIVEQYQDWNTKKVNYETIVRMILAESIWIEELMNVCRQFKQVFNGQGQDQNLGQIEQQLRQVNQYQFYKQNSFLQGNQVLQLLQDR